MRGVSIAICLKRVSSQVAELKREKRVATRSALSLEFLQSPRRSPLMLIAIVGPPQAGKHTLANHLVTQHQFTRVHITSSAPPPLDKDANSLYFSSSSEFLDHATQTWRVDYVTTDLKNKLKLQEFSKRPFVAVVAVDAPIGVRFKRAVASSVVSNIRDAS